MTASTITNYPAISKQTITPGDKLETPMEDLRDHIKVGDFLEHTLVTDTSVLEVINVTAKTVTLRRTRKSKTVCYEDDRVDNGSGYTAFLTAVEPDEDGETRRVRLAKNGRLKVGSWARAGYYRKSLLVNGLPVSRTDLRF